MMLPQVRKKRRSLVGSTALILLAIFFFQQADAQETIDAPPGNVANGILIYQQRCANCHGPIGLGDGELSANLENAVPPIGSSSYAQVALPSTMFDVISNGNLERGMPPFGDASSNSLSEQERWDVIAAAFAMSSSAQSMLEAALSADDQTKSQLAAVNWTNTTNGAVLASLTDSPLDDETKAALVDWGRMTHSATYFLPEATVLGQVVNGTRNQPLSEGDVSIIAFEGLTRVDAFAVPVNADGSFELTLPSFPVDWFLRAEMAYEGLEYAGQFIRFEPQTTQANTDIRVFDTTDSDGGLRLEVLNTVIEVAPGALVVNQLYAYQNVNSAAYVGGIVYGVPDSAENISFSQVQSSQFVPLDISSDQRDDSPIFPGENSHTIFVRYVLPYENEATIEHTLGYTPQAMSLVTPDGIEVSGDGWQLRQQDEIDGQIFNNYVSRQEGQFSATLRGITDFAVDPTTGERLLVRNDQQELFAGTLALAITAIGAILVVRRWQKQATPDSAGLLQEIADLDSAYAVKAIKRKAYEQRRRELKQQIRDIWE